MAKCSKCAREVGCGCNLTKGLCSNCAGTNFIATKERGSQITASQKENCELSVDYIGMLIDKLSCIIEGNRQDEINTTLANLSIIKNNLSIAILSDNICSHRPFVQLAEQLVVRINNLTPC